MTVNAIVDQEVRPPMVKFERRAVEDKAESRKQGKIVYKDEDFALVIPPYSRDRFEAKVDRWFENVKTNIRNGKMLPEWFDKWQDGYEKFKKGEEMPLDGTSVKNWPAISQSECKRLIAANILTIEDLAQVNDEGIRRLGMGALELKNKAKAFVQLAKDTGPVVIEMAALRKEAEQKDAVIASLAEKVEALTSRLESLTKLNIIEPARDPIPVTAIDVASMMSELEEEELSIEDRYIAKFGKKPHHLMKPETILKKLEE